MPTVNLTLTGQALSKVDDTNVTLTLGGTPLTALLKATSITVGWTGQLSVARGGTGLGALGTANQLLRVNALGTALEYFTPTYGSGTVTSVSVVSANGLAGTVANATTTPAITLSTSINSPVLAGNGTALIAATTTGSGSTVVLSTSPTFVTDISAPKIISSTASGGVLLCNNNGVTVASFGVGSAGSTNIALIGATAVTGTISGTSSLTLGTASTTVGSIVLNNATNANTITIQSGVTSASYSVTLPTAQGGANTYLKNDGTGTLSWATVATGISIGDTVGNSPVTGSILMAIGGVVTQSISYRAQQATPFSTAFGFESHSSGSFSGVRNTSFGYQAGKAITTATDNTFIGYLAGTAHSTSNGNTCIGRQSLSGSTSVSNATAIGDRSADAVTSATFGTFIGSQSALGITTLNYCTFIGSATQRGGGNVTSSIVIGADAFSTKSNQCVIGSSESINGGGKITEMVVGAGVRNTTSPSSVLWTTTSGSGTNNAGSSLILASGASTGSATPGTFAIQTATTLGSGTTLQSLVARLTISGGAVTTDASTAIWADKLDFVFNTGTGTKLGTGTTQKIGFWNATPIVQPASANQAALSLDVDVTGADTVDKAAIDANFSAIQTLVNQLRSDLVAAGLIKGSA